MRGSGSSGLGPSKLCVRLSRGVSGPATSACPFTTGGHPRDSHHVGVGAYAQGRDLNPKP